MKMWRGPLWRIEYRYPDSDTDCVTAQRGFTEKRARKNFLSDYKELGVTISAIRKLRWYELARLQ